MREIHNLKESFTCLCNVNSFVLWVSHVTAVSSCLTEPLSCVKLMRHTQASPEHWLHAVTTQPPRPALWWLPTELPILTQPWSDFYSFLLKYSDSVHSFIQQIVTHVTISLWHCGPSSSCLDVQTTGLCLFPCLVLTEARMILWWGKLSQISSCQISQ